MKTIKESWAMPLLALSFVLALAGPFPATADPIIYATAGAGKSLVKIDVGAQKVTTLGDFGVPGADAIAINAKGEAFTVTHGWPPGGDSQLARMDLATGQATPFGTPNKPENFMGLGFAPDGTLYGVNAASGTPDAGSLYKFNPVTGAATKAGVTGGCFAIMDLAWAPDGTMYGAVNDSLYRVDAATGQATLVTKLQGLSRVMGLAIDDLGNFYVSEIVTNAPLVRVDPVTGATTKLFDTGVDFIHGLDIRPVPKPIIYATAAGKLVTIDIASGEVTTVGSLGVVGAMGLAFAPDGTAYSVTESCGSCAGIPRLVTIERTSGKVTVIAPTTPRTKFQGIVYSPQRILYGVDAASGGGSGSLFTLDPATGNVSRVGARGAAGSIMDLAFHPNGTLYGIEGTRLYTIDPTTGARTLAKQLKGLTDSMGLAIDDDGTFYAADYTSPSPIVRIDLDTGQATPAVRTKINLIHGLDLLPPPAMNITWQGDRVVVTWPAWAAGFVLQATETFGPSSAWVDWPGAPTVVGDRNTLAVAVAAPARFFRLIRR
ncbi:MAG: PQQ-binding-like beta-propeller repeat protein [Verrucomicrobia bacterium]|nr:PQQ-binding-like beta-propeller repeat protein [Verrucomicrobiota bacterium]